MNSANTDDPKEEVALGVAAPDFEDSTMNARKRRRMKLTEQWLEIIKETGPMFPEGVSSETIGDLLYDEYGLPK